MKKLFFSQLLFLTSILTFSQGVKDTSFSKKDTSITKKNVFKINLFALPLKTISVQYERAIGKKMSLALGVRYMPDGSLPLKSSLKSFVNDPEAERQIDNINIGNFAFTPELRFYLSRKNVFRGFYIAPFARIARYSADLLYEYDDAGLTKTIPVSGSINTFTGGLLFGAQWKLGKSVYLDWWLFGPNYGNSNGTLEGKKSLSSTEQQSLRDELSKLEIPLTNITYTVNANGATINLKGPWAGIISGLCLGIRF